MGNRCERRSREHAIMETACSGYQDAQAQRDLIGAERGYYMCRCHVTHNFFVRSVGMHFEYDGDDAAFLKRCPKLPDGASPKDILGELQRQRAERLRQPVEAAARAQVIRERYVQLHPEVYQMQHEQFLTKDFREIVGAFRDCGSSPSKVETCIRKLKEENLLVEVRNGIWKCNVFTRGFCDLLEAELSHFSSSGLPKTAPNTMNRYGIILSELGFGPGLTDPFVRNFLDPIAGRLFPLHANGLDSHRTFTVLYDAALDGDRELALHYDNAEVTLNVNLGGSWEGGQVSFYGLATENSDDESRAIDIVLQRGEGVFHAGLEMHRAQPILSGRRHNLIFWCRSSAIRNDMCPMCWQPPSLLETNKYACEGFRPLHCDIDDDDLYA